MNWDRYDVFVVSAPTAFGKTALAKTFMNAFRSVSVITPANLLVEQFRQEFPDTCTLARLDSYRCEDLQQSCTRTRATKLQFCRGCPAGKDLATAKYRKGPGIYNYHTYLAHKLFRDVLVVDEAHNLVPVIKERFEQILWKHDLGYPSTAGTYSQMLAWVQSLSPSKRKRRKIQLLEETLLTSSPEYVASRARRSFNGKGTQRGQPEERDCIILTPVDISTAPPLFWPREVAKIVLLSATISSKDIEALGLHRKRVLYVNCESPIPAPQRPIVIDPCISLSRETLERNLPSLGAYVQSVADAHKETKGVIHATYALASQLSAYLTNERYMFHSRETKRDVYQKFRSSPPEEGKILVACGMYEGIDLPEDLGRWQVIAKIPWPSLADPGVRYMTDKDPDWYLWETWKIVMQACGRICRTPEDFGETIIFDSSIKRLLERQGTMLPQWFQDGIEEGRKYIT